MGRGASVSRPEPGHSRVHPRVPCACTLSPLCVVAGTGWECEGRNHTLWGVQALGGWVGGWVCGWGVGEGRLAGAATGAVHGPITDTNSASACVRVCAHVCACVKPATARRKLLPDHVAAELADVAAPGHPGVLRPGVRRADRQLLGPVQQAWEHPSVETDQGLVAAAASEPADVDERRRWYRHHGRAGAGLKQARVCA